MSLPRRYTTEALVLRHMDYGEADRILTLYTLAQGKVHAIAKGIRRSRSRSSGHLDLFTRSTVLIARGRNLDIVSQAQSLEHFSGLRTDLVASGYAHYAAELLDSFAPDHLPNRELYALQLSTLRMLDSGASPIQVRAFELVLLDISGYRPQLHACLSCGKPVVPEANQFSVAMGGILCADCRGQDPQAKDISVAALKLLRNLQTHPDKVIRLQSMERNVGREIERRLHEYIAYRLEKRLKSIDVLARIDTRLAVVR